MSQWLQALVIEVDTLAWETDSLQILQESQLLKGWQDAAIDSKGGPYHPPLAGTDRLEIAQFQPFWLILQMQSIPEREREGEEGGSQLPYR
jgi:hypothetical protein